MNATPEELREFLTQQANKFYNEMVNAEISGDPSEYALAFGAYEAYRLVTRWINKYEGENNNG